MAIAAPFAVRGPAAARAAAAGVLAAVAAAATTPAQPATAQSDQEWSDTEIEAVASATEAAIAGLLLQGEEERMRGEATAEEVRFW